MFLQHGQYWKISALCRGFSAECLASAPHGQFLKGLYPHVLTLIAGVRFREWLRAPRHFWSRRAHLRYGPFPPPHPPKNALFYTHLSSGTFIKYQFWKSFVSCWGFSAECLAFMPDGKCSMGELRPKGPRLRLGHLWHPCTALDIAMQFKL